MKKNTIVTRVAPSPTGFLHIGTARTALFNYLFAKKNQGKFILRIEDTDLKRSKKEYEIDIIEGMKWLGIKHDGKIFYQSQRKNIYSNYAKKLIQNKNAYIKDGAVWFKINSYPQTIIKYNDLIMGELTFKRDNFNDFVIIKSDGVPLYMFAAVVDDYEMGLTHIIRGDDHINSTPQQIMLYKLLGFRMPKFAHIPLILNQDKTKMSKRKNPVSISNDFRSKGYLPEAMLNYMAFLGWNSKTEKEIFSLQELIKEFSLTKINRSGAIFDVEKLNWFNNYYLRQLQDKKIYDLLINEKIDYKDKNAFLKIKKNKSFTLKIISVTKSRANNLQDFFATTSYFYCLDKYKTNMLIFKKSNRNLTLRGLKSTLETLDKIDNSKWKKIESINKNLIDVVNHEKLSNGDVFWPVRVALSGLEKSPSPKELLWVLGKEESIKRINLAIKKLSNF